MHINNGLFKCDECGIRSIGNPMYKFKNSERHLCEKCRSEKMECLKEALFEIDKTSVEYFEIKIELKDLLYMKKEGEWTE